MQAKHQERKTGRKRGEEVSDSQAQGYESITLVTGKVAAGGTQVQGQPKQLGETLLQKQKVERRLGMWLSGGAPA